MNINSLSIEEIIHSGGLGEFTVMSPEDWGVVEKKLYQFAKVEREEVYEAGKLDTLDLINNDAFEERGELVNTKINGEKE